MRLASLIAGSVAYISALECSAPWGFAGPTAWTSGAAELQTVAKEGEDNLGSSIGDGSAPDLPASTSTHRIAAGKHGTWLAATANAGIWRTANISAAEPHWESVTDGQPVTCAAMAALDVASFNNSLVVAGCGGSTSGEMGKSWNELISGEWKGVMISVDGGDTWAMTNFPANYNIGDVRFQSPSTLLVAARGHFFDPLKGGIWRSTDLGKTWSQTFTKPTVSLTVTEGLVVAALGGVQDIAWQSSDSGLTWQPFNQGIQLGGYIPFYAYLATTTSSSGSASRPGSFKSTPTVFLAVYAVDPTNPSVDRSLLWYRPLAGSSAEWLPVPNTPDSLDSDKMPKDKIAVLADPNDPSILYVAGNLGNIYRVEQWSTKNANWVKMGGADAVDGSSPHADCRHLAWDHDTGDLILTNDGGIHRRTQPQTSGGRWFGSAGDIQTMEYTYAHWDARNRRFVAGAQDNSVQITLPRKAASSLKPPHKFRATGVVGGDGNRVLIDNVHCPSRMFGSAQFLDGLSYFTGGIDGHLSSVGISFGDTFKGPFSFPYFVMASALNSQNPSELYFYVNGTTVHYPPGVYKVTVPDHQSNSVTKPKLVAAVSEVLEVVVGGFTDGKPDPTLIMMLTTQRLYTLRSGQLSSVPLPMDFFTPITLNQLGKDGQLLLGPLSHGNTVWLSVSPRDSNTLAVTGWPTDLNNGDEGVFYSVDGGANFANVTGNLAEAVGASTRIRPQGVLVVDLDQGSALLVGTVNGVYVSFTDSFSGGAVWTRVGSLQSGSFPLVMTAGLSYEPYTDTLVAATYGRGVFVMENAKQMLQHIHDQQKAGVCDVPVPPAPSSSAPFFPPMQSC